MKGVPSRGSPLAPVRRGLAGGGLAFLSYSFFECADLQGLPNESQILATVHFSEGQESRAAAVKFVPINPDAAYHVPGDRVPQVRRRSLSVLSD